MGWLVRKAIGAATVTITVKQYADAETGTTRIDIEQSASGLSSTNENRALDWSVRDHKDWLFGAVKGQSKFVSRADLAALVAAPDGEARREGWADSDFLALDWEDGGDGQYVLTHVVADAGWFATQAWGFQDVGGERRYVRNVVVAKGDKFENFKMVYDFISE